MKNITSRAFRVLGDCDKVYQFMVSIYERDRRNGIEASFFEYAYVSFSCWMDITYSYKNRIWEDNGEIVAFCFYESPITEIYFCLKPGYEELAPEMIAYADKNMIHKGEGIHINLSDGQTALIQAAKQFGYYQESESWDMEFDFEDVLDYSLSKGFHFVKSQEFDMDKIGKCCWKGFDHEMKEGVWDHQYDQNNYLIQAAPHATTELAVAIADEAGEYACFAGMWWIPENKLAYLEPLCTIPEYRHKGLAAAALSELYRRTKALGATHMTGGDNDFYKAIGYKTTVKWTRWRKR